MVDSTVTSLPLSAGLHHIAFKAQNGASLAGYRVLYSGPDTLASGAPNGYQALTPSNLYYPTGRPTLANNFHWAGRISNDYTLGDGVSSSVDMLGSPFGAVVTGSFTMGNQAVLNVVNGPLSTLSAGWLGLAGPVSLGNGAVLNTGIVSGTQSAGTLNLIGPVTQSGTGADAVFKAGQGTLILGADNTGTFTGDLTIANGTVKLESSSGLPAGVTTVRSGAAVTTASPVTASGSNAVTLGGADTVTSLNLVPGMVVTGTNVPANTIITGIVSATSYTVSNPVVTPTTGNLTHTAGGTLDLNGQLGVLGNVTISGTGQAGYVAGAFGALWNSSYVPASLSGGLTLSGGATVGGYGDLTLGLVNSGAGVTLTKTGGAVLAMNGDNALSLLGAVTVNVGTLRMGHANALGDTTGITTVANGAVLDLNGFSTSENITVSGAGFGGSGQVTGYGSVSSLGAMINSGSAAVTLGGTVTMGATTAFGTSYVNAASGVAQGGDITVGVITGTGMAVGR
jgi:autotransporter-associated beta strand protein